MAKVRNLSDIQQETAFTEFDFYQRYEENDHFDKSKCLLRLDEIVGVTPQVGA